MSTHPTLRPPGPRPGGGESLAQTQPAPAQPTFSRPNRPGPADGHDRASPAASSEPPAGARPAHPRQLTHPVRRRLLAGGLAAAAALAGCAPLRRQHPAAADQWAGRLALTVHDEPVQRFSAGFELQGSASRGALQLNTPLGTTLATARWSDGQARLESGGQVRDFASLQALLEAATGARLPVDALFGWLAGADARAAGWQVDLSRRADGRILARRPAPAPAVELRILLEP